MPRSNASTVDEYLDELPPERREVISAVRELILRNLPSGFQESVGFGMINYCVPLSRYPKTYNGQPLGYIALAAQKNYNALYLMSVYSDPDEEKALRDAFAAAGKKLDIGKSCVRFRKLEDLALDAIAEVVAGTTPEQHIARHEAARKK